MRNYFEFLMKQLLACSKNYNQTKEYVVDEIEEKQVKCNRQISVYIDTREIMKVAEHNGKFCNIPKHGRK